MADLAGISVDLDQSRISAEARRRQMADHVVDARTDHEQQVRFAERRRARSGEGQRVIVGNDAAALRRGVERDTQELDQLLELGLGG